MICSDRSPVARRLAHHENSPSDRWHSWLHAEELARLDRLPAVVRRESWVWGRVVAKRLLYDVHPDLACAPSKILIRSRDERGLGIAPRASVDRRQLSGTLSISHTNDYAYAAFAPRATASVGVDVAQCVNRGTGFLRQWFTESERNAMSQAAGDVWSLATMIWAAKEAGFKAIGDGESFQPRRLAISLADIDRDGVAFQVTLDSNTAQRVATGRAWFCRPGLVAALAVAKPGLLADCIGKGLAYPSLAHLERAPRAA